MRPPSALERIELWLKTEQERQQKSMEWADRQGRAVTHGQALARYSMIQTVLGQLHAFQREESDE